ncbi:hypothetical protein [Streptomyces griseorubiginosus]|uniref:hypothetical protein n=1 Tax=Streptomyces griseorubiginosus TaxID=67304 RepID=UPI001AD6C539|nr:hypothetical protein [Streptomyces griseorubiginosus]MBO4260937.1 hypothetical protein [Streptomyces griseorubiginosus]
MHQTDHTVRTTEALTRGAWPPGTQAVSYIGPACVIHGHGDFDPDDLTTVRDRFPHRHVTLDGDTITVWPPPRRPR